MKGEYVLTVLLCCILMIVGAIIGKCLIGYILIGFGLCGVAIIDVIVYYNWFKEWRQSKNPVNR